MSLRDKLLALCDRRYCAVQVGEDEFWIQSLTELERSNHELCTINQKSGNFDYRKLPEAKLRLLCSCLVDGNGGDRLFADAEWAQLQALDSRVVAKLYEASLQHCGWNDEEVEDLVKNSSTATD